MHVDFVCCDVLQPEWQSLLITEFRLFDGMTHQNGEVLYQALLEKLKDLGFEDF